MGAVISQTEAPDSMKCSKKKVEDMRLEREEGAENKVGGATERR